MNLQYIYDNSTSPPTQSVLQYKVDPDSVYASTDAAQKMMVDLSITVSNPTAATVSCQSFQFGIYVGTTESAQLASTSDGVQLTTQQSQWSTNTAAARAADLYWYTANPASGVASEPLASLGSFTFQLMSIPINDIEGATHFMILEMTGSDPNNPNSVQGPLSLTKEQGGLEIKPGSFTVTPGSVSPHTEVNLSWDVVGSDHWLVRDPTRDKTIYDSIADPPAQMQCQDVPPETSTYELKAYAGQTFTTALALVEVTNPHFLDDFPPTANPPSVDSGTASIISWKTADAQYVIVTADGGYSSGKIDSSDGSGQLQVNPVLTTTYTVTTYGADGKSGEALGVTVSVNPPNLKSFTASSTSFEIDQPVTLSWVAESVTTLTLDPGGINIPLTPNSFVVNPKGRVVYQLTAAGQGLPVKSDPITVTQNLEVFSAARAQALAYDGTNIWVGGTDSEIHLLAATDGHQVAVLPFPTSYFPTSALIFDGTYVWVGTQNSGNGAVTRFLATDWTKQETYVVGDIVGLAYDGTNIWMCSTGVVGCFLIKEPVYQIPGPGGIDLQAIVYDGTYIWVANRGGNSVIRLLAADANNQETFQVGSDPLALFYDGTYIWVANAGDKSVTRLRATGTNQDTFRVGSGPQALASSDDNTYIWVANAAAGTVTRLRSSDGSNQGTFVVGNYPAGLVYDCTYVWVSNLSDGTVTRIRVSDWPPGSDNS